MPNLGCGGKCAKYILLIVNFLISLIGLVLLGLGIFIVADKDALLLLHVATTSTTGLIIAAAVTIIVVGLFIFFVGGIGCYGASRESASCLTCYSVILIILLICQVVAAILAGVFYDKIMNGLSSSMKSFITQHFDQPGYNTTTEAFNFMQFEFKCCGVDNPMDWEGSVWQKNQTKHQNVPDTCCVLNNTDYNNPKPVNSEKCQQEAYNTTSPYAYTQGCENKFNDWIKKYIGIIIGVVVGFLVVQLVIVVISCLLKSSVASRYEYV